MNSNSQEAQQSQTIADARKWAAEESAWLSRQELPQSESVEHMDGVLQIVDSQAQKIEAMEGTLHRIAEWCKAYPIEVFPEPDFNIANNLLKQAGMSTDSIAASMARHIMGKLQELLK